MSKAKETEEKIKIISQNKKAFHDFEIGERFEAGIVLLGTEVKSLREGRANLKDSYARAKRNEVFLYGLHISPYTHASFDNHEPERIRKLLLHKAEIKKLLGQNPGTRVFTCSPENLFQRRKGEIGNRSCQREKGIRQAGKPEEKRRNPRDGTPPETPQDILTIRMSDCIQARQKNPPVKLSFPYDIENCNLRRCENPYGGAPGAGTPAGV